MQVNGAKEKLMAAFDRTQSAYEHWQKRLAARKEAESAENSAQVAYMNAKDDWERALKACSPGDAGQKKAEARSV